MAGKMDVKSINIKKILFVIMIAILAFYVLFKFYYWYVNGVKTEAVVKDTINESIKTTGLIIRDETIVYGKNKGIIMNSIEDAEKVSRGGIIAQIYSNEQQVSAKLELKEIEREIEALKKLNVSSEVISRGPEYIDKQINNELRDNFMSINDGVCNNIKEYKENVLYLVNERQAALGKVDNFFGRISELQERKNELLKNNMGSTGTINSEYAGYFVSRTDGYEECIDYDKINELTINDIDLSNKEMKSYDNAIGKIIKSVDWYVTCKISPDDTLKLSRGDTLNINIPSAITESIPCKVLSINQSSKEDDALVVLSCNRMDKSLASIRNEEVEIIINRYTGLKIKTQALRENIIKKRVEGEEREGTVEKRVRGVYVKYGNSIIFKEVSPIYMGPEYVICDSKVNKDVVTAEDTIQLGDEVVVEGTNLYDGKYIR